MVTRACGCPDRPGTNPHSADRFCRWAKRRRRSASYKVVLKRLETLAKRSMTDHPHLTAEIEAVSRAMGALREAARVTNPDEQARVTA